MIKDAEYMRSVHTSKFEKEFNSILNDVEKEALNGNTHIRLYMGNSDDDEIQLKEKINLTTNKLTYLGFKVKRECSVQWRLIISNLVYEYLDVYW